MDVTAFLQLPNHDRGHRGVRETALGLAKVVGRALAELPVEAVARRHVHGSSIAEGYLLDRSLEA